MLLRVLPLLIVFAFLTGIDYALITNIKNLFSAGSVYSYFVFSYLILVLASYYALFVSIKSSGQHRYPRSKSLNYHIGFAFAFLSNKVIFVLLFFIGSTAAQVLVFFIDIPQSFWFWWTVFCVAIVVFIFSSMMYGMTLGKYNFEVESLDIKFSTLPASFHGLRVAQISDIHSGTWDSIEKVGLGVQKIQEQNPDIILFTGDLVNHHKDEINPYIAEFAKLQAPLGKYAVLGNHDYVGRPRDPIERSVYWEDFMNKFKEMGFDLLINDNRVIHKGNESIRLVGVENWGTGRFFPKKGDLNKAFAAVNDDEFCLLMSHDPSHWDEKVLSFSRHVDLTLSGHTHGMQFGLNYKWLKWSPVRYRYKRWIGLHDVDGQKLYVNRGFGMLAFPGRVGMSPEISMITLMKED